MKVWRLLGIRTWYFGRLRQIDEECGLGDLERVEPLSCIVTFFLKLTNL